MTDNIHSCSYFCELPACVKEQRDRLRDKYAGQPATDNERDDFEAYMQTREAPSAAKKKLGQRDGDEYLHPHVARHWYTWQKARAARQIPAGWKLVPIEATQMMCDAALNCQDHDPEGPPASEMYCLYKSMLEAAPTPPEAKL